MNSIAKGSKPGRIAPSFPHTSLPQPEKAHSPRSTLESLDEKSAIDYKPNDKGNDSPQDEDIEGQPPLPVPAISRSATVNSEQGFPEGGLRAWLVVLGSFCGMVAAFGFMNSIGAFQTYISNNQLKGYNQSTIAWIFSIYVFLAFFGGLQIGPVFDAKGPRMLILSGSIFLVAAIALMSICTQYWHFMLTVGILAGCGTSLIFTPAMSSIGHFFHTKRAAATGLAAAGGSIGGVIFPLMLQRLFPQVGWAWSTRILALIDLVLCTISATLVRSRLPPKPGRSILPDFRIFRQPALAYTTAGTWFWEWGLFIPITYISSYIVSTHVVAPGSSFPFVVLAILNAGSSLGRYLPGIIADIIGRFNAMILALFLSALTSILLWLPATVLPGSSSALKPLVLLYAIIFGFASGSNISLTPVCIGQLCKSSEYGRYYGTSYFIVSFGTLTGIPIAGALLQACKGGYLGVAIFTGACYVLSLVCFVLARREKVGWRMVVF